MDTNPTPYALAPEEGEAFWGFGALWTLRPPPSRPAIGSRSSRSLLPEVKARRFTSIGRTTRRSTSLKESLRSTSVTNSPSRHPQARLFTFLEEWCMPSK